MFLTVNGACQQLPISSIHDLNGPFEPSVENLSKNPVALYGSALIRGLPWSRINRNGILYFILGNALGALQ
jgi:hypothetical protein